MRPTEFNALLAVVTNYLYTNLNEREYTNLAIFFSLLSKEMLSMEAIRDICKWEEEDDHRKK